MVRVYSQPYNNTTSLGGLQTQSQHVRRSDDLENFSGQRRQDEKKKRKDEYADDLLDRPPEDNWNSVSLQRQIDGLSEALSRLQGYSDDAAVQSKSYPNSAQVQEQARKTWSAPNKDPFGPRPDLTNLADPMGRRSQASQMSNYVPSFGSGQPVRTRRGGGNAPPPLLDREAYLQELKEQMKDQQRRKKEVEDGRDWWEKSEPQYDYTRTEPKYEKGGDLGDARKQYEQELRQQMEYKRRLEDARRDREKEEDEKLERRTLEQQERMKREFDEEMARKKAKEEAKLRRQEELMRRQAELQREMAEKKKNATEKRLAEKRGGREPRFSAIQPRDRPINSPPIPTLRDLSSRETEEKPNQEQELSSRGSSSSGKFAENQEVIAQLTEMRRGLERRRDEMIEQEKMGRGVWQGLEE